jgi:hypothetical protein
VRAEFGATWADLIRDWCLGAELQEPPFTAWLALEALDRLWPEYVDRMVASQTRGVAVIAMAIHLGSILRSCEPLVGFCDVLRRLRGGEQSALPELFVAANLVRVGWVPELEPRLDGNRLDCVIRVDGTVVYIEVISPERGEAIIEAHEAIQTLATRLKTDQAGRKIELLVSVDLNDDVVAQVRDFLSRAANSEAVQEIPGIGAVIVEPFDGSMVVSPRIRSESDQTVLGAAVGSPADASLVSVRMAITDSRVQRLLAAELHHFSRGETNLLVIDVSRCAGSIRGWTPLIERRFQPQQNRRLGGAAVYQLTGTMPAIEHRWRILRNPHAYRPVPDALTAQSSR